MKHAIHQLHQENFHFSQNVAERIAEGRIDRGGLVKAYEVERQDQFCERVIRSVRWPKEPLLEKEHNAKIANQMRKHTRIREVKIVDEHLFTSKDNQHYAFV